MSFLRKALHLCTGFANYQDILEVPVGTALRYLSAVIALCSALLVAAYLPRAYSLANAQARWFDRKIPAFSIQDGQLKASVEQPFRASQDNFLFVLDTTGTVTAATTNKPSGVLLTRDSALFWFRPAAAPTAPVQTQQHSLKTLLPDGTVNGDYIRRYLHSMILVGAPVAVLGLFLLGSLAVLAHAWFFTFTAAILERSHPTPLTQPQLRNIALHAVTPAALVLTVYAAFGLSGIDWWLLYLVVYGVFLIGAANACRRLLFGEPAQEDEPV